ncbi:HD domain-containing protein [Miniphocaeibacter massiliensis]|uniref:HD domain-containing protein n=1 Tax=Miniphocaeibacter massiliensis TaxID=2041841 RepID=UPI000C1C2A7B|nr:HD domain-containing protein [Miniphocaeibacter massiliensis]
MTKEIYEELIEKEIEELENTSRYEETKEFIQHGETSVYEHSIKVAYLSCEIAMKYNLKVDYKLLIRGALLHDYFLYDWHDRKAHDGWHGFRHPKRAWENAKKEFSLTKVEGDIILKHMFPLVPFLPKYKESWIVCMADKISATTETVEILKRRIAIGM